MRKVLSILYRKNTYLIALEFNICFEILTLKIYLGCKNAEGNEKFLTHFEHVRSGVL